MRKTKIPFKKNSVSLHKSAEMSLSRKLSIYSIFDLFYASMKSCNFCSNLSFNQNFTVNDYFVQKTMSTKSAEPKTE